MTDPQKSSESVCLCVSVCIGVCWCVFGVWVYVCLLCMCVLGYVCVGTFGVWVCVGLLVFCVVCWYVCIFLCLCVSSEYTTACRALGQKYSKFSINVGHYEGLGLLFFFNLIFLIKTQHSVKHTDVHRRA